MAVVEGEARRVIADGRHAGDLDVLLLGTVMRCEGEWPWTSADGLHDA